MVTVSFIRRIPYCLLRFPLTCFFHNEQHKEMYFKWEGKIITTTDPSKNWQYILVTVARDTIQT